MKFSFLSKLDQLPRSSQSRAHHPGRSFIATGVGRHTRFVFALIWSLCVLCPSPCVLAQQTAQTIAALVDHHYNVLHSLRVNFVQEYTGLGQQRRESGVLLLKKPGRMRWTYSQPPGKLFVLDGHDAYFYSPGQNEVQRVPAKKLDDLRSPLRFLLGRAELSKELTGMQIAPQGENYELSGLPNGMRRVASLHFTVSAEGVILGIKVEEADGSVSTFTFSGEVPNPPAREADFAFRPPAGTAVVNGLPPE